MFTDNNMCNFDIKNALFMNNKAVTKGGAISYN
jgi:predicted outer membrane repeat protein